MDEIVQQVAQRVGIPEDKARMAVNVVMEQLEKRLPSPIAAQLKSHLSGGGAAGGMAECEEGAGWNAGLNAGLKAGRPPPAADPTKCSTSGPAGLVAAIQRFGGWSFIVSAADPLAPA